MRCASARGRFVTRPRRRHDIARLEQFASAIPRPELNQAIGADQPIELRRGWKHCPKVPHGVQRVIRTTLLQFPVADLEPRVAFDGQPAHRQPVRRRGEQSTALVWRFGTRQQHNGWNVQGLRDKPADKSNAQDESGRTSRRRAGFWSRHPRGSEARRAAEALQTIYDLADALQLRVEWPVRGGNAASAPEVAALDERVARLTAAAKW